MFNTLSRFTEFKTPLNLPSLSNHISRAYTVKLSLVQIILRLNFFALFGTQQIFVYYQKLLVLGLGKLKYFKA